jgi:hypothetical protein
VFGPTRRLGHDRGMDVSRVAILREVLAATGWTERTRAFARSLRGSAREPGSLLLVGTPDEEPWHLAAHLDDEARYGQIPELSPTLVRWSPPAGAAPHLAVSLDRLEAVRRGETVFVVAPDAAPAPLLERVWDARKTGATVLSLDAGDRELAGVAHDSLSVPAGGLMRPSEVAGLSGMLAPDAAHRLVVPELTTPAVSFDTVQHLVSMAAGEEAAAGSGRRRFRDRLTRLLDAVSGPPPQRW